MTEKKLFKIVRMEDPDWEEYCNAFVVAENEVEAINMIAPKCKIVSDWKLKKPKRDYFDLTETEWQAKMAMIASYIVFKIEQTQENKEMKFWEKDPFDFVEYSENGEQFKICEINLKNTKSQVLSVGIA